MDANALQKEAMALITKKSDVLLQWLSEHIHPVLLMKAREFMEEVDRGLYELLEPLPAHVANEFKEWLTQSDEFDAMTNFIKGTIQKHGVTFQWESDLNDVKAISALSNRELKNKYYRVSERDHPSSSQRLGHDDHSDIHEWTSGLSSAPVSDDRSTPKADVVEQSKRQKDSGNKNVSRSMEEMKRRQRSLSDPKVSKVRTSYKRFPNRSSRENRGRQAWSPAEDKVLRERFRAQIKETGRRWCTKDTVRQLTAHLPGRSVKAIRSQWGRKLKEWNAGVPNASTLGVTESSMSGGVATSLSRPLKPVVQKSSKSKEERGVNVPTTTGQKLGWTDQEKSLVFKKTRGKHLAKDIDWTDVSAKVLQVDNHYRTPDACKQFWTRVVRPYNQSKAPETAADDTVPSQIIHEDLTAEASNHAASKNKVGRAPKKRKADDGKPPRPIDGTGVIGFDEGKAEAQSQRVRSEDPQPPATKKHRPSAAEERSRGDRSGSSLADGLNAQECDSDM